jgi:hypothetical protein
MTTNTLSRVERGYSVDVAVLRIEKIASSKNGNPRYRFHTDSGIYTSADDIQQSTRLTGAETGAAVLRIEASRVIGWQFTTLNDPKE